MVSVVNAISEITPEKAGRNEADILMDVITDTVMYKFDALLDSLNTASSNELKRKMVEVTIERVLSSPDTAHSFLVFEILKRRLGKVWEGRTMYWPNVPRYLVGFVLHEYVVHSNWHLPQLFLCLHVRTHLTRSVSLFPSGVDGSGVVYEYVKPARYVVVLVNMYYGDQTLNVYPTHFNLYKVYDSKKYLDSSESDEIGLHHPSASLTLEELENEMLPHAQACLILPPCSF
jgi:hypothetical protein